MGAKELFDSISSCWTSDSDLDYVSDDENGGTAGYGKEEDSDTSISLSESTDLPPVPPKSTRVRVGLEAVLAAVAFPSFPPHIPWPHQTCESDPLGINMDIDMK